MVEAIKLAEKVGISQTSITDHVVMGTKTDRYPYGDFPTPSEYPWIEPLTLLTAVAAVTERIRLSTSVLIATLRSPPFLAKMAASLDVLSGGRLDLGVGSGWQREEFEASGVPYSGRNQRLFDTIGACRALWSDGAASFNSATSQFKDIYCEPSPVQKNGIPVLFGLAPTESNCQQIAKLGDGWIPINPDPDYVADGAAKLRKAFEQEGRSPEELMIRTHLPTLLDGPAPSLDKTLEGVAAAKKAGATHIEVLPIIFCQNPDDLESICQRIAAIEQM